MSFDLRTIPDRMVLRLKSWGALAQELPIPVDRTSSRVLNIGPGDWLVVSSPDASSRIREELTGAPEHFGAALSELSDGLICLEVRGAAVRDVLSKGSCVDFHVREFRIGQCKRTRLAQVPVVIDCTDESRFELWVVRSYAAYLKGWLEDAAIEFAA
jgi:sarcosine oxidase subunit gamma